MGLRRKPHQDERCLKIIHPTDNDFYEACREKLGWSLDITANKK